MTTDTVWAYVAGLFDGEGSVVIDVPRSAVGSPCHFLRIAVSSTSRVLIDWLIANFGGSASNDTKSSIRRGRRPCWAWRLSADQARDFLEHIYPYTIEKKKQAALAIEFQRQKGRSRTSKRLPADLIAEREWFRQEISRLNLNGRAHKSPAAWEDPGEENQKTTKPRMRVVKRRKA
jgi:hypothetical protein